MREVEDGANAGNDLVTVVAVVEYKGIPATFPVVSRVYPLRVLSGFLPNLGYGILLSTPDRHVRTARQPILRRGAAG